LQLKLLFFVSFSCFGPKACQTEAAIKKQEDCKNDFNLSGKVLKSLTYKHIDSENEVQKDDKPGEVLGKFLHDDYR
jgi:hypothetical protein